MGTSLCASWKPHHKQVEGSFGNPRSGKCLLTGKGSLFYSTSSTTIGSPSCTSCTPVGGEFHDRQMARDRGVNIHPIKLGKPPRNYPTA